MKPTKIETWLENGSVQIEGQTYKITQKGDIIDLTNVEDGSVTSSATEYMGSTGGNTNGGEPPHKMAVLIAARTIRAYYRRQKHGFPLRGERA